MIRKVWAAVLAAFFCPYCGAAYNTDAEGYAHMQSAHPGAP